MRNFIIFIALLSVNLVTHGDIKSSIFNRTESIKNSSILRATPFPFKYSLREQRNKKHQRAKALF